MNYLNQIVNVYLITFVTLIPFFAFALFTGFSLRRLKIEFEEVSKSVTDLLDNFIDVGERNLQNRVAKKLYAFIIIEDLEPSNSSHYKNISAELENDLYLFDHKLEFLIKMLPISGLLGTFLGLMVSVFLTSQIMGELSSSNLDQLTNLIGDLTNSLSGMSMAFVSSFVALILSLIYGKAYSKLRSKKDQWLDETNFRLLNETLPNYNKTKQNDQVEKHFSLMRDAINNTLKGFYEQHFQEMKSNNESLKKHLKEFFEEYEKHTDKRVDKMIYAGEKAFDNWKEAKNTFNALTENMKLIVSEFSDKTANSIIKSSDENSAQINNAVHYTKNALQEMTKLSKDMEQSLNSIQKIPDDIGHVVNHFKATAKGINQSITSNNILLYLRSIDQNIKSFSSSIADYDSKLKYESDSSYSFSELNRLISKDK